MNRSVFELTPLQKKLFAEEYDAMERRMKMLVNNQQLYRFYKRALCDKYNNIHDATSTKIGEDQILVFLPEIECYGIFTAQSYHQFLQSILDYEDDNDTKIDFGAKQIILTGCKQRVIILCVGEQATTNATKIQEHARNFFNSDIDIRINSNDETEIMIKNKTSNNFEDTTKIFHEFYDYVYNKDKKLSDEIKLPKIHLSKGDKYIHRNVSFAAGPVSVNDIISSLATIYPCENVQINIAIGNNCTINGAQKVIVDKKQVARDWIKDNPPNDREFTTDYYKRYVVDNNNAVAINQFGKFVESCGFNKKSNGNARYWIKK